MTLDTRTVSRTYFEAWMAHDFDTLRSLLADDVHFDGPLATLDNADDAIDGLRGMSEIVTDIVVRRRYVEGEEALTMFDLHTSIADPLPTANWSRVHNGKITDIRVAFDATKLAAARG